VGFFERKFQYVRRRRGVILHTRSKLKAPPGPVLAGRCTYIGPMRKTLYEIYWMVMFMALAVGLGLAIVEGAYQVVHYIA
jgi:hypothetical protein